MDNQLVTLLSQLEPGYLPEPVFQQVARLMVTVTVVIFPILKEGDKSPSQIQLTQRKKNDLTYPSTWHPPGTVLRPTDQSILAAIDRLLNQELPSLKLKSEPKFIDVVFEQISRGKEVSLLYSVEIEQLGQEGQLFDIYHLPDNVVPTDKSRIQLVWKKLVNNDRSGNES